MARNIEAYSAFDFYEIQKEKFGDYSYKALY
jgi:hypothetical protein